MNIGDQFTKIGTDDNDFTTVDPIIYTVTLTIIGVGKKRINYEKTTRWIGRDGQPRCLNGGGYGHKGSWFEVARVVDGMPPIGGGIRGGTWSKIGG